MSKTLLLLLFLCLAATHKTVFALDYEQDICNGLSGIERSDCLENARQSAAYDLDSLHLLLSEKAEKYAREVSMPDDIKKQWEAMNKAAFGHWVEWVKNECDTTAFYYYGSMSGTAISNAVTSCKILRLRDYESLLRQRHRALLED